MLYVCDACSTALAWRLVRVSSSIMRCCCCKLLGRSEEQAAEGQRGCQAREKPTKVVKKRGSH